MEVVAEKLLTNIMTFIKSQIYFNIFFQINNSYQQISINDGSSLKEFLLLGFHLILIKFPKI